MPILDDALLSCENIELTARWIEKEEDTFVITFDTDGGNNISTLVVKKDNTVKLPENPKKDGYKFKEWTLDGKKFDTKMKITKDIILKAKYDKIEYVTVKFDSAGGSAVEPIKLEKGTKLTLPVNPTMKDAGFRGWLYSDSKQAKNGDIINNDVTLKAKWEKAVTYTVTFDSDGGALVESMQVEKGTKLTLPSNPTKTGYTFDKWVYSDSKQAKNGDIINNDVTLKAKWEKIIMYTVTFDSDGGSLVEPMQVEKGAKLTLPSNPTKTNYNFVGWYDGDTKIINGTVINSNMTLKARWKDNSVKINYVLGAGGSIGNAPTTCRPGELITLPTPTKSGSVFKQWIFKNSPKQPGDKILCSLESIFDTWIIPITDFSFKTDRIENTTFKSIDINTILATKKPADATESFSFKFVSGEDNCNIDSRGTISPRKVGDCTIDFTAKTNNITRRITVSNKEPVYYLTTNLNERASTHFMHINGIRTANLTLDIGNNQSPRTTTWEITKGSSLVKLIKVDDLNYKLEVIGKPSVATNVEVKVTYQIGYYITNSKTMTFTVEPDLVITKGSLNKCDDECIVNGTDYSKNYVHLTSNTKVDWTGSATGISADGYASTEYKFKFTDAAKNKTYTLKAKSFGGQERFINFAVK